MKIQLALLILLNLSFCSDDNNDCKGEIPDWCTHVDISPEYDPVCGCDGITYHNAGTAECSGVTSFKEGECKE